MFSKYKKINKEELHEAQKINDIVVAEKWKLQHISANTMLIPGGQKFKEQQEAIVNLLEQKKNEHMGQLLAHLGYPSNTKASINLKTGDIKIIND